MERLKRYRWPGNVRELENLIRRLAALYPQETITDAVIEAELDQPAMSLDRRRRGGGRHALGLGRAAPRGVFPELRRRPAAAGALSPHPARGGEPADQRGAGLDPRQPDQGGGAARRQPQHAPQEDPGPRHPGDPGEPVGVGTASRSLRRGQRQSFPRGGAPGQGWLRYGIRITTASERLHHVRKRPRSRHARSGQRVRMMTLAA